MPYALGGEIFYPGAAAAKITGGPPFILDRKGTMRKARLLSLFGAVSLVVALICIVGIPGGRADEPMDRGASATLSPYAVLYSFGSVASDGTKPYYGSLILSGTTLYGMTTEGGANGKGTLFMFDTKKNVETVLHSFGSDANDGIVPWDSLILSGTTLYGMTTQGGANANGTIFMFDTKKNVETILYSFRPFPNDGNGPCGSLIISGTTLYGMTTYGGAYGQGTIFKFDLKTKVETVLYSFGSGANDGAYPQGSLTLSGTTLYGMTPKGGAYGGDPGYGTIFQINTQGKDYKVLYNFGSVASDGNSPYGSLILSGTTLYGMTNAGGANDQNQGGDGTIFMFDTKKNVETVLHSFGSDANDGIVPWDSLIISGTTLYGMTSMGGAENLGGNGTIFMFDTKKNVETVLYSFGSVANDGSSPIGSLVLSGTTLYGMTAFGGANDQNKGGYGTIFSIPDVPLSTISGTVTQNTSAGPAMQGVTVTLSLAGSTETQTTGTSGAYSFPYLAPGNYTVTPSLPGYAFTPKSGSVTVNGSNVTENFTGAPVTISGTVTFNGAPVTTDLIMDLSGKATGTDTPNASGYLFGPLANGTYKVSPALTTHSKPVPATTPASASIVINGKSATQSFTYKTNSGCFVSGCHTK
jgi:uncharacterized repeat protein (TIGR03803 family)